MCFVPYQACDYLAFLETAREITMAVGIAGIVLGYFVFLAGTEQRNLLLGVLGIAAPCFVLLNIKRVNGAVARWAIPFLVVGFASISLQGTLKGEIHGLKRARAEFRLMQNPRDDAAIMALAESMRGNNWPRAQRLASRALKINPRNTAALMMLGSAAHLDGYSSRCIKLYERSFRILKRKKNSPPDEARRYLADCYKSTGRDSRALRLYDVVCSGGDKYACERARHMRRMREIRDRLTR